MDQVHLKDWGIWDDAGTPEFRALGEGSLDWPTLVKECRKAGTKDFIVEEDNQIATNDPFVEYGISRKYLKTLGL